MNAQAHMAFDISITRHPEFVELVVSGENTIGNFVELVDTVERETVYWSDRRVLADLRATQGELTPTEQVFLGELVAQNLPHLDRLASVVQAERITRNSETAARQQGLRLRVFASRDEATAWLSEGMAGSAPQPAQTQPGAA